MDISTWLTFDEEYSSYDFDLHRLTALEKGPLADVSDLDAALSLLDAIAELVEGWEDTTEQKFLTGSALRVLQKVCFRKGIDVDLTSKLALTHSPRREYEVWDMLQLAHAKLLECERLELLCDLDASGWPSVDEETAELRRLWKSATTAAQYSAVGNQALRVLEFLSLLLGHPDVPRNQSINRLLGALDAATPSGKVNSDVKDLVRSAVNLANAVKHDAAPSRVKAGAATHAALCVVGIFQAAR